MSIIVTPGETVLIAAFQTAGVPITIENLLVGDAHIRKDDRTVYIFERKAKGDLDASIKDGRYHEQKSRLLETGVPRKNIVYVIEQLAKASNIAAHKRVWGAICNTQHRDGFTVFQTKSVAETVDYLLGMATSVSKFKSIEDSNPTDEVNINIKKRQVGLEEWFKYSLTLIPKCSLSIAEIITTEYPNATCLISAIEHGGMECLSELKHGDTQRRIGKKLSEEICVVVLNNY